MFRTLLDACGTFSSANAMEQLPSCNIAVETKEPADSNTTTLISVLERGLDSDPAHAGLCHFYVHAMEMAPLPILRCVGLSC
jgi:hypothetical protein